MMTSVPRITLACAILLIYVGNVTCGILFLCGFERQEGFCNMTGFKKDAHRWHLVDRNTKPKFKIEPWYAYTKPVKVSTDFKATLATQPLGHQGRVCVWFIYAAWPKPMAKLELYGYNPPDETQLLWEHKESVNATPWQRVNEDFFLQCRDSFIGFVAVGDVYLNNVAVEKGCCDQTDCKAEWGTWASWEECDRQCGEGTQYRQRICDNPNQDECIGDDIGSRSCTINVHCEAKWGMWTNWATCDATCGEGRKRRTRTCQSQSENSQCVGNSMESEPCTVLCVADESDGENGAGSDGDAGAGSDGEAGAESDGEAGAGSDSEADAGSDSEADSGSDSEAGAGSDGEKGAESDGKSGAGSHGKKGPTTPKISAVDAETSGKMGTGLLVGLILLGLLIVAACVIVAVVVMRRRRQKALEQQNMRAEHARQMEIARIQENQAAEANRQARAKRAKRKAKKSEPPEAPAEV